MERDPRKDAHRELTRRIDRVLSGTSQFKAPESLEAQVWNSIESAANLPWWRQRVLEWPLLAQLAFVLTGVLAAAAMMLGRPATSGRFAAVINHPATVLPQSGTQLHATLDTLAVFHRLTQTVAGALPDIVWYGGIALCALAYMALFFLVVFGYRLLQAPAVSR